jgi:chromosome segregation protein
VHLRSITLVGFKTFARQIEIAFDPGVTAVVGPNGSGKSNIVDAFKWVLGETQARDLRGKKMEEVIYSGGERRPRASAAEVTIVIDNSDRRLPLEYGEVAIRRRVDRSGQSDYFLNGSRVRRRDLLELLTSTGLTTDSYAIVDQRDIEAIITSTPEQRRLLIEVAAQVRGVKAKRTEAANQLKELAGNLVRLEDLRGEIEPRLAVVREQAAVAREAAEARRRLELLRGSIAWEEWREARDAHRRASNQVQGLQRKLEEAREAAAAAESEFRRYRAEMQAAQDRRLQRQRAIGAHRLAVERAQHELALAEERRRSQAALAEVGRAEEGELAARQESAGALCGQLAAEVARAERELAAVPEAPPAPEAGDAEGARAARQAATAARRRVADAQAAIASARARCQVLGEQASRLAGQVEPAEAALPEAEATASRTAAEAREASEAAAHLRRLRAELEGLESLRPAPRAGLKRLGELVVARPGYEAALSAALGPLLDAWAAPDQPSADRVATGGSDQATVLYPEGQSPVETGSLLEHVEVEPGFEDLARRLLGRLVVGREVTLEGVYREPGLVRAGSDPRVKLATRRQRLIEGIARLEALAAEAPPREEAARSAQVRLHELRSAGGQRRRLDETARQLEAASAAESEAARRLPELEGAAAEVEAGAARLSRAVDEHERRMSEHRAEVGRLDLERMRWRERVHDLGRQLAAARREQAAAGRALEGRAQRRAEADREVAAASEALPAMQAALEHARAALEGAERESPDEEAELAEAAKRLVTVEEARVDARLRASTLEGNVGLLSREAELAAARMEELRSRMPEGMAPEEVPGGKAREREMRQLERRLLEIGPTNELAESESAELEERYGTLLGQLDDIAAARGDLDELIGRLRSEEESRYDAVFGAVAANFQEYFAELTEGGKATLRHVAGDDGPRSGVEILVQPPRKRMQNVTLLSSGERSLTAFALVLALQQINPAPFTILDEVDAALDDANVGRYGDVLQRLGRERQFMIITHNHLTMASALVLYGVHVDESGCSHLVSVKLQDLQPARKAAAEDVEQQTA